MNTVHFEAVDLALAGGCRHFVYDVGKVADVVCDEDVTLVWGGFDYCDVSREDLLVFVAEVLVFDQPLFDTPFVAS